MPIVAREARDQDLREAPLSASTVENGGVLDRSIAATEDAEYRRRAGRMQLDRQQLSLDHDMARVMAKSGVYKDLKDCTEEESIAKAQLKIMLGRAHGMTEMEALQSIYIVNGRPSVSSDFRAARMKRAGYTWDFLRNDATGCSIALFKDGKRMMTTGVDGKPTGVVVTFEEADAKRAGLLDDKHGSGMYQKWGRLMYWYKCISYAQKFHAPEVLGADFANYEDAIAEGSEESRSVGEVSERLNLQAPTGTRDAQVEVAEKKIAEAAVAAKDSSSSAPKPAMTLGRRDQ